MTLEVSFRSLSRNSPINRAWLVVVAAILLAGCGGRDPNEPADGGAAAVKVQTILTEQGYAAVYEYMHPEVQAIVSRDSFLECGERNASGVTPFPFIRLEPILVRDLAEAAAIPSLEKYVPADDEPKIVTLRIQQAAGTIDLLWFVAKSDGRWTWFLGSTAIGAYQEGTCPAPLDPTVQRRY